MMLLIRESSERLRERSEVTRQASSRGWEGSQHPVWGPERGSASRAWPLQGEGPSETPIMSSEAAQLV